MTFGVCALEIILSTITKQVTRTLLIWMLSLWGNGMILHYVISYVNRMKNFIYGMLLAFELRTLICIFIDTDYRN